MSREILELLAKMDKPALLRLIENKHLHWSLTRADLDYAVYDAKQQQLLKQMQDAMDEMKRCGGPRDDLDAWLKASNRFDAANKNLQALRSKRDTKGHPS